MRLVERSQQQKAKDQRRTAKGSIGAWLLVGVVLVLMLGQSSFGEEPSTGGAGASSQREGAKTRRIPTGHACFKMK
jgi:hypothetical protein